VEVLDDPQANARADVLSVVVVAVVVVVTTRTTRTRSTLFGPATVSGHMKSKRRRTARHRSESVSSMLAAYRERRPLPREGVHPVLRWLTIARSYEPHEGPEPPCPMDAANAVPELVSADICRALEQRVAARVLDAGKEYPIGYLEYAAAFFKWWYHIAAIVATPTLAVPDDTCSWLSGESISRSLVVPDVRRSAAKLSQLLEIRAGEFEIMSALTGSRTRTLSTTLQALRTPDWNVLTHHTLMYGTLLDIYHANLLGVVQLAVVDSRYQGRINFEFVKQVMRCPASQSIELGAWPLICVHGAHYITIWRTGHIACSNFAQAYTAWRWICVGMGGIIGGRFDVRKCTI